MDLEKSDTKPSPISVTFKRRIPNFFFHYKLLLWKSTLLRIREPWVILGELLLPALIIIVVVGVRFAELPKPHPPCHLVSQPLPSMGFINYMRHVVCNFNYTCSPHDVDDQSRAIVVPMWMSFLDKQSPKNLEEFSNLVQTFSKLKGENQTSDDQSLLSELICQESISSIITALTPPRTAKELNIFCSSPAFIQRMMLPALFSKVASTIGRVLPKRVNSVPSVLIDSGPTDFEHLRGQIRNVSILFCGNQMGSNSFLSLVNVMKDLGDKVVKNALNQTWINAQTKNATVCSIMKSIFTQKALRPWTTRLRSVLEGEVFYYPITNTTQEIMKRANNTAVMLEKLKEISTGWMTSKDTLIPHIFVNSTMSKTLRIIAILCSTNPNLNPKSREQCRRLNAFLKPTPTANYIHWTELLPLINSISEVVDDVLNNCVVYDRFYGFSDTAVMYEALREATANNRTVKVIEFKKSDKLLDMQFRLQPSVVDATYKFEVTDKHWTPAPRHETKESMKYFTSGFIDLQDQVERAYISVLTKTSPSDDLYTEDFLPTEMQFVPAPCYEVDPMLRLFSPNIPLVIVVIWLCNYVINVRAVVYEKEIRLKEFTKVMGMGNAVHWLNWFTVGFIMMTAANILVTVLLKCGKVFPRTDGFILFCCFTAYILAILPQAFMTSVFFTNASLAAVFSGIFYFIMFIFYYLIIIYELDFAPLMILTFSPQCAIAMTFSRLMNLEVQGFGGQWSNLWTNDIFNESFPLGLCLLMLLVDGLLAWICVWYLENVVPTDYDLTRKWYFPFTQSYWTEVFHGRLKAPRTNEQMELVNADFDMAFHEPPDAGLNVGVSVRGLTKRFGRKKIVAVNNMWVDFYENQITSFLGHNGAGKTTTISILTGIYAPSAGTAYVYGQDINYEMPEIRNHLGLCPQHNILFDNLSVAQHIRFYGYLKGLSKDEVEKEVNQFLVELKLEHKANELSKNLSGGQKRRLSLAAAFVGGSKIVFLDEPTAGVDPSSRRTIWNLIFRFKASRTIILTTHHMDEADFLGDRIAIVSQGRIKASGSSLFLKSKFAKYYYLSMEKSDGVVKAANTDSQLTNIISTQLEGSELSTSSPTEWVFTLPAAKAYDEDGFVRLFTFLEENSAKLSKDFGVKGIGLSDTSLEEIFMLLSDDPSKIKTVNPMTQKKLAFIRKLFKRHTKFSSINNNSSNTSSTDADGDTDEDSDLEPVVELPSKYESTAVVPAEAATVERNTGCRLYLQQCHAYLAKRRQCVLRSKRGWILEIALPAFAVTVMMAVIASYSVDTTQPSMPLHPWLMSSRKNILHLQTFFSNTPTNISSIRSISDAYSQAIASARGWSGTRCLPHFVYKLEPERYAYCNLKDYTVPNPLPALTPEGILEVQASEKVNCFCKKADFFCPSGATVLPPNHLLPTTDYLMNLTNYNVSNYLLKSRNSAILKRYGGFTFMVTKTGSAVVLAKVLLSNQSRVENIFNSLFNNSNATALGLRVADFLLKGLPPTQYSRIWYHNKGFASSVAYLNVLHNLQLRMLLAKNKVVPDPEDHGIAIANFPLPSKSGTISRGMMISLMLDLIKAVGIVFALSFISSSFSTFVIRERKSGFMAMQLLAGQNRVVYWGMSYLWDFLSIIIPITIIVIVFIIFNEQAYIGKDHVGAFIVLMLTYGLAITPLMYCFTFAFRVPSVAFVTLLAINIVVATVTAVIFYTLDLISYENPNIKPVVQVLEKVFLIFPQFAFCRGFYELAKRHTLNQQGLQQLVGAYGIFDWGVMTGKLVALLIEAVVFSGLVLLISYTSEANTCEKCKKRRWKKAESAMAGTLGGDSKPVVSEDVMEEIGRVENDPMNEMQDVVRAINLTKCYPKKVKPAVNELTFGVRPGECFGLLGVNGAGKTTTFNMLTTTIRPTSGTILIGNCNITEKSGLSSYNLIGYCPQFDALLPHLTGFETLQLFARIHGYPERVIPTLADRLIDRMSLRPHAYKPVHTYSGGNLRKLSTAVATVGNPQVLLLDEPTSGMDPGAKRCLWKVIKSLQKEGCSVVLTTHSMEECEALCNRLAIMMDGQFQCFGTVAHLKQRFGEGYILEVDLGVDEPNPQKFFPPSDAITLTDAVGKKCNFEAHGEVCLSKIFKQLLALRSAGKITTFAVRQVSLDSVFVNFVRSYENERGDGDYDEDLSSVGPDRMEAF